MKAGRSELIRIVRDLGRKPLTDNQARTLIESLWRDYLVLYNEKFKRPADLDEFGEPIDEYQRNKISELINFGQALGQDHLIEGNRSAAIGQGGNTTSFMELLLGAYPILAVDQDPWNWIPTDRLVALGNGPDEDHRSNVFEILKNGFFEFLYSIKIGEAPALGEGETRKDGTLQWTPENRFEEWVVDHWEPLGGAPIDIPEPDTITEETENFTGGGKHTHKLEIPEKGITEIVKSVIGENHESYLIENTTNTTERVDSSWTVLPYNQQVGEFKAVVMIRDKTLNEIKTLMNILSFDYTDAVKVVNENQMLIDGAITLTCGIDAGTHVLYAEITGMTENAKRIHLCFERCVLGVRYWNIEAEAELILEASATLTAYLNMQVNADIALNFQAVMSGLTNVQAQISFALTAMASLSAYRPMNAAMQLSLGMLAELTGISGTPVDFSLFYNLPAVNDARELAPTNWRIAGLADYMDLITFYGGEALAGGDMKLLEIWTAPNSGATADSKFKALPAGQRNELGEYSGKLTKTIFWIKTE